MCDLYSKRFRRLRKISLGRTKPIERLGRRPPMIFVNPTGVGTNLQRWSHRTKSSPTPPSRLLGLMALGSKSRTRSLPSDSHLGRRLLSQPTRHTTCGNRPLGTQMRTAKLRLRTFERRLLLLVAFFFLTQVSPMKGTPSDSAANC